MGRGLSRVAFLRKKAVSGVRTDDKILPMKNSDRKLVDCLKQYALTRNANLELLSHDWIAVLTRGELRHLVYGYDLGLNGAAAAKIANDKGATYSVLTAAGLPAVEHRVFLHPRFLDFLPVDGNWPGMRAAFADFAHDAVIKDNEGTGGVEVFRVRSQTELEQRAHQLMQIARAIALSPFLAIEAEQRFVMLESECVLAYAKERASGEWRHNLGLGARALRLDPVAPELLPALSLARSAMAALTLRFASIDIVTVAGEPMVLEANAGVMLEAASRPELGGPELAERIYTKALDLIFSNRVQDRPAPSTARD